MKILTFILFLLPALTFAQKVFETRKEALAKIQDGTYTTSTGWQLKQGEQIQLGRGSMPDKTFAFVIEIPNLLTYNQYSNYNQHKLQHTYNGRSAVIRDFLVSGTKKSGFYIMARIKVGQLSRYGIDIENAIEAAEIKVPEEYAKQKIGDGDGQPFSKADELKKLKELLDSGALTQEEYDAEKKKVLAK